MGWIGWRSVVLGLVAVGGIGTVGCFSAQPQNNVRSVLTAPGPIPLGKDPVEIHLKPGQTTTSLRSVVGALKSDEKLYLVLRGLRINRQPGVVFQIYHGARNERPAGGGERRLLGTMNFFSVPETSGRSVPASPEQTTRTFDVTQFLKDLPASAAELVVTIQPSGPPSADSAPAIGTAEVVISR